MLSDILGQFQNLTPKGEMSNISKQRETPASTRLTRVIITYNHGGITTSEIFRYDLSQLLKFISITFTALETKHKKN